MGFEVLVACAAAALAAVFCSECALFGSLWLDQFHSPVASAGIALVGIDPGPATHIGLFQWHLNLTSTGVPPEALALNLVVVVHRPALANPHFDEVSPLQSLCQRAEEALVVKALEMRLAAEVLGDSA